MRGLTALIAVGVLAGPSCGGGTGRDYFVDADPGDPFGGTNHRFCANDGACSGGMVCARTMSCWPATQIHAVHVTWTVKGMPTSDTTCMPSPDLVISFHSDQERPMSYAPVPCVEGKFSIDKLPTSYTKVRLGGGHFSERTMGFDADGNAVIDLSM